MSIYRIPIVADNVISTYSINPSITGLGNAGASQILNLYSWYNDKTNKKYLAHIIAKANITALTDAINSNIAQSPVTDSTVTCNLKFFNINHANTQAFDFTAEVYPLTRSWTEGRGTRIDSMSITGISNWLSASNTAMWTTNGGDFKIDSSSATQYFDSGYENFNVNIRTMLVNWLNGSSANNGFLIKMDGIAESTTGSGTANTQWYRKSFHGRTTNFQNFAPYIQLEWDDVITDKRNIMTFGISGKMYFYNVVNGVFSDIDSITASYFPGTVAISGATANTASAFKQIFSGLSAARVKTGVYSTSFTPSPTASTYSFFKDTWSITSAASAATSAISMYHTILNPITASNYSNNNDFDLTIVNWNPILQKNNIITKQIFVKQKTTDIIPLVQSESNSISSIAASTISSFITTDSYYRILVDPLGVVDVDWQKISYDSNSNFFVLNTDNFSRNIKYNIEFKLNVKGQTLLFNSPTFKFELE